MPKTARRSDRDSNQRSLASRLSVRWTNVRSFTDTGWQQIRPLTVVVGPNNSGKTSFHLPLLLLKQTLLSRDSSIGLMTRGPLVNAGSFRDLVSGHDVDRQIDLSIQFHHHTPRRSQELKPLGEYPPGSVDLTFSSDLGTGVVLSRYRARDMFGRLYLERRRLASGRYSLTRLPAQIPRLRPKPRSAKGRIQNTLQTGVFSDKPQHFLFSPLFLTDAIEDLAPDALEVGLPEWVVLYVSIVGAIREEVSRLLQGLDYLGPLRRPPQRLYKLSGETPQEVGSRGENAPELLFRSGAAFRRGVGRWLRRLGLASRIDTPAVGDEAFAVELRRGTDSPWVNLADTGFGTSQVLPLIVQSLREDRTGLLVAEQPEIHLNPRLQALLSDLFVEVASEDHPVIVETHSEHLVLRLRRLIAEGKFNSRDVALYYVEKTGDDSVMRGVPIQTDGHVDPEAWPRGFFGESLTEALGLAQAQIRNR